MKNNLSLSRSGFALLLTVFLFLAGLNASAATVYYVVTSGSWNQGSPATLFRTSGCTGIAQSFDPTAADDIIICNGVTLTLGGAAGITNLTVSAGGELATNNKTITITGNLVCDGTISGTGTVTMPINASANVSGNTSGGGAATISAATIFNLTSTGTAAARTFLSGCNLHFLGNVTTGGSNGQTVLNSGTITIDGTLAFGNAQTFTNNGTFSIGNTTGAGTWIQGTNSTLNYGGATFSPGITATASGNLVNYNSITADQTVRVGTYVTLNITKSTRTAGLAAATTVNGDLNIVSGKLDATAAFSVLGTANVAGTFTATSGSVARTFNNISVSNTGTWSYVIGQNVTINGNIQNDGTFNAFNTTVGTHTLAGANKTISGANAVNFVSATVSGTYTNNGTLSVSTELLKSGTGSLIQGANSTLNIAATAANFTAGLVNSTASGNTVNYNGTSTQTILVQNYYNLSISGSRSSAVTFPAGTVGVAGNFDVSGATNSVAPSLAVGNIVSFNGSGSQAINATSASWSFQFLGVSIANTGGTAPTNNVSLLSNMKVSGNLSFAVGNKSNIDCDAYTLIANGTVTGAGANGWVNGNLQKPIAAATGITYFQVGDATLCDSVKINFTSIPSVGTLTVSTDPTDASLTNSAFDSPTPKTLQRHWDIVSSGVAGAYDITVYFNNSDIFQNGADPLTFYLDKLNGSTWAHNYIASRTSNSTTVSGVFNSFSTFEVGNYADIAPGITASSGFSSPLCPNLVSASGSISATVAGFPVPTVSWQESTDNGFSYSSITAGTYAAIYTINTTNTFTSTSSTLTLSKVPSSYSGNLYKGVFFNSSGSVEFVTLPLIVYPTVTASISGGGTICNGQSATVNITLIGISPWTVTYTDGTTPITVSGITSSPYSFVTAPASSKTYTLTSVTDANGCAASSLTGSAVVTVVNQPAPSISINAGGSTDFCYGNSVTLAASQTSNLVWSNGATSSAITITAVSGNYTVTYTSPGTGCSSTSASVPVNVKVAPEAKISVTGNISGMCPGDQATLNAIGSDDGGSPALTYQWYDTSGAISGQTSSSLVVNAPPASNYWVVVTNNNGSGCSSVVCP